eukprot:UN18294
MEHSRVVPVWDTLQQYIIFPWFKLDSHVFNIIVRVNLFLLAHEGSYSTRRLSCVSH